MVSSRCMHCVIGLKVRKPSHRTPQRKRLVKSLSALCILGFGQEICASGFTVLLKGLLVL